MFRKVAVSYSVGDTSVNDNPGRTGITRHNKSQFLEVRNFKE